MGILPNPLKYLKNHLSKPRVQHSKTMQFWRGVLIGENRSNRFRQLFFMSVWNKVKGDYVEFGVASGKSMANAFFASDSQNDWYPQDHPFYSADRVGALKEMQFFGFDSFEGLPKVEGLDKKHRFFDDGMINCSLKETENYLKRQKVDMSRVHLVKGFYSDVLNDETRKKINLGPVAIVFIDCDLYQSAKEVLTFITPHIVDGTVVLFDDWFLNNGDPELGVQRAFNEWREQNKQFRVAPYIDQRTFVILNRNVEGE